MLENALLLLGIFGNGGCQVFLGSRMVENVLQLPIVFWIENFRKCLDAARHILDHKS
jgi:hypothetical protein